ncbi:MAG TPA: hypothetical protein VFR12_03005, partial [Pyrinomonadaceae bacterium]|nr:hypothetical protein [Pyrinomonadaceae bacterium]
MKRALKATLLVVSLVVVCNAQQTSGTLTNASVIKLVKAGFKEKTIITIISNRPTAFNLGTEQLIELKRSGVNETIILAMLSSQMGKVFVNDEDEWENDSFFKDLKRPGSAPDAESQGTGIFGSGGSSQSQSRSRGGLGGNQNEGSVT